MSHLIKNTLLRRALKTIMWIVIVIWMIPVLLYIPSVQRLVKDFALEKVSAPTGLDIEIEHLLLQFPLDVDLGGVIVREASGDTMIAARKAVVDVKLLPLLRGQISIDIASLDDAYYRMGTPDSLMYLTARVKRFDLDGSDIDLSQSLIEVSRASLDGGVVDLVMRPDTAITPIDTTASTPWLIKADDITLRNVGYRMKMQPTIDSLGANMKFARLTSGIVDIGRRNISARAITVDSVTATYLTPSIPTDTIAPIAVEEASPSAPWTITSEKVILTNSSGVYASSGATPAEGLDMNYLSATNINIEVDSFYNRGVSIRVPLTHLSARERCGVVLDAKGLFEMDSVGMTVGDFDISTMFSAITLNAYMGMGNLATDESVPLRLDADAKVGIPDLELLMPSMKPLLKQVPRYNDLRLFADVDGTAGNLRLHNVSASLPGYLELAADGRVLKMMDLARIGGEINLDGEIRNVDFIKPTLLEAKLMEQVNIPPMTLTGNVAMSSGTIDGTLQAITGSGELALDGHWSGTAEDYEVVLALDSFPVNSFMPLMGVGVITADFNAQGHGLNPLASGASLRADAHVSNLVYDKRPYSNIQLWAKVENSEVNVGVVSLNDNADCDMQLDALIVGEEYRFELAGDVRQLDLRSLNLSSSPMEGSLAVAANGTVSPLSGLYDVTMTIDGLDWTMDATRLTSDQISASISADSAHTDVSLRERDLSARFVAPNSLDSLLVGFTSAMTELDRQLAAQSLDVKRFQETLPPFCLTIDGGNKNIMTQYLDASDMGLRSLSFYAQNDSLLSLEGQALGFRSGSMRLDSISFDASQYENFLVYNASIDNKRGTMDAFAHVNAKGYLADNRLCVFLKQKNISDSVGFDIGAVASLADSVARIAFAPYDPTIGYKKWNLNSDNFIEYNISNHRTDANFRLTSDDSYFNLFTQPIDSLVGQKEMKLQIAGLQISEWLSMSPFAPPMRGVLSADLGFRHVRDIVGGKGTLALDEFYYDRRRVGSFLFDLGVATDKKGKIMARADLLIDSIKTMQLHGLVNDTTKSSPYQLDFSMIKFPLHVLNPFMPKGTAEFHGMLNGDIDITGDASHPILNGSLAFDSTKIKVDMIGTSFSFSPDRIPIVDNVISFSDYTIRGVNDNPLAIDGAVDLKELTSPKIDLEMTASDMQVIGSDKSKKADVYGKAFIDLNATLRGNMETLDIDAYLDILGGTNVTYIMRDVEGTIATQQAGDMVRFIQFTDSVAMAEALADTIAAAPAMAMNIDAVLKVEEAAIVNVDLSTDGGNRVQLQGDGEMNYTMTSMGDSRFTGRYTIDKGFVRYTPPLMTEKHFNFVAGSYVAFNGDMLNPILNISAIDDMRVTVSNEGQDSRQINFDVSVDVTGTLSAMNVTFDLEAKDDVTIANELQTMSAEQRANQAMNMLLYNAYTGPGSSASGNIIGNPLYSFLESQINTWAANNIKGVDISFGIDQYDSTKDGAKSTSTSYSYRVSKALFNDRFKIVIGGNYSTDADVDENFAQNLINDISFEYMLNRSGSMYVKLFRHVGYESILEGEVIQTGVGFVYKRKLRSLRELFRRSSPSQAAVKPKPDESNNP